MTLSKSERRYLSTDDPRSFLIRALPLTSIGDIAVGNLGQSQLETITWSTSADWDNAVTESYVDHESDPDVLNMRRGEETWEDLSDNDAPPDPPYSAGTDVFADDSRSFEGSISLRFSGYNGSAIDIDFTSNPETPDEIALYHNETGNETDWGLKILNENGFEICWVGSNNPQQQVDTGSSTGELLGYGDYGVWNKWRLVFDYTNQKIDIYWTQPNSSGSGSVTNEDPTNSFTGLGGWEASDNYSWHGGVSSENSWLDSVWGVYSTSTLTTGTKSFSTTTKPNLENLSYTLNGESITLDIIGSPGTASEEIVTQSLDGTSSFPLTWSNSHTDFRIKSTLSTTTRDGSSVPSIDRLRLKQV